MKIYSKKQIKKLKGMIIMAKLYIDNLLPEDTFLPQKLSSEEMKQLWISKKNGDYTARDKLITYNMRLVAFEITRKFYTVDYDKEELFSVGNIGLIKAVDTYDETKKIEFSTYAIKCIDNEIFLFLRKQKRNYIVCSLEDAVKTSDNEETSLRIKDVIQDVDDYTESYESKEFVISLLNLLSERDQQIMMLYFGFYNDKTYTQREIADKLGLGHATVSKIIFKSIKKFQQLIKEFDTNELFSPQNIKKPKNKQNTKNNERENANNMRKVKSIYEYLEDYSKEEIDKIITSLSDEDKKLLIKRYGEDLSDPKQLTMTSNERNKFYGCLIPKIKRQLNQLSKFKNQFPSNCQFQNNLIENPREIGKENQETLQKDEKEISQIRTKKPVPVLEPSKEITKEDYQKILELLRKPSFAQMLNVLSVKEAVIISLRLGYINGLTFSTESIAKFLEIDEDEVREITKKALLLYKDNINEFLDKIINITTDLEDEKSKSFTLKP